MKYLPAYVIVALCIALGTYIVCRPARRNPAD